MENKKEHIRDPMYSILFCNIGAPKKPLCDLILCNTMNDQK